MPALTDTSNSGEKERIVSIEYDQWYANLGDPKQPTRPQLMLQDYKKFKHGKEVSQEVEIQYLKQLHWHKLLYITNMWYIWHMTC